MCVSMCVCVRVEVGGGGGGCAAGGRDYWDMAAVFFFHFITVIKKLDTIKYKTTDDLRGRDYEYWL